MEAVTLVLEFGADLNAQNEVWVTRRSHAAVYKAWPDVVELLVAHGGRLDLPNKAGKTAADTMCHDEDGQLAQCPGRVRTMRSAPGGLLPLVAVVIAVAGTLPRQAGAQPSPVPRLLGSVLPHVPYRSRCSFWAGPDLARGTRCLECGRKTLRPGENVVLKLRAGMMPPAGQPRPDDATYEAVATWLER